MTHISPHPRAHEVRPAAYLRPNDHLINLGTVRAVNQPTDAYIVASIRRIVWSVAEQWPTEQLVDVTFHVDDDVLMVRRP